MIAVDVGYGSLDWSLRSDPRVSVMERTQRARADAGDAARTRPTWRSSTSRSSRWPRCSAPCSACLAPGYDVLALVKPQFEVGRGRVGKGGVVRDAAERREALVASARPRSRWAPRCSATAPRGCPGPKGNRETFVWLADPHEPARRRLRLTRPAPPRRRRRGRRAPGAPGARGRAVREITVLTHRRPDDTTPAARAPRRAGRGGRRDAAPGRRGDAKHAPAERPGPGVDAPVKKRRRAVPGARRRRHDPARRCGCYAGTDVPVFAVNFGEIGFLATVEPEDIDDGMRRALEGDFELLRLPGDRARPPRGRAAGTRPRRRRQPAVNDIAIHRKVGERVAEIAYALDGEDVGSVRCDGLVVATPAGSTGYNLANGGPVMAWGVEGLRRLVHRAALADRARAGGRAGRPPDDPQPLARAAGHRGRRAPGGRDRARGEARRALRQATSARSPSCPARRSTAACARSSAAWPADAALSRSARRRAVQRLTRPRSASRLHGRRRRGASR